jgi:signal peptidase I
VSRSSGIHISEVRVENSGSLNAKKRNNLSGGILLEEGTADFEVRNSSFKNIPGNALWTHSLLTSPQLLDGAFIDNKFESIGRDAIQVGHAKRVKVEGNTGREIGYPFDVIDVENGGTPVAIDTAGDVPGSQYERNRFDEVNGKCIDLDGFHDGLVLDNACVNRFTAAEYPNGHFGIVMNNTNPNAHASNIELSGNLIDGAKYGGLFMMGSNNHITNNRFVNLNLAGCNESSPSCVYKADEPQMLESGIYIGRGVARLEEAKGNVIRNNTITGHKMKARCVTIGPGILPAGNSVESNTCQDYVK